MASFKKLGEHRNRVMHFFHPDLNSVDESQQVAQEFLIAWYHLHRIAKEPKWSAVFKSVSARVSEIDAELQALHNYLKTVFSRP